MQDTYTYKRERGREKKYTASRASTSALKPKSSSTRSSRPSFAATSSARSPPAQHGARASARARTQNCLAAQRRRRACGDGVGVGAGLEEALGVFVLAQLHLRKQGGLAGAGVLALECRVPGARDKTALTAVLWYGPRTINLLSIVTYPRRALSSRLPLRHARAQRTLVTCS